MLNPKLLKILFVIFHMSRSAIDKLVRRLLQVISALSLLIVGLIAGFLLFESRDAILQLGWRMYSDESWFPNEFADNGTFGLFPIAMGTVLVSLGATLIAAPLGIGSAIFSQFYASPKIAFLYRRLVELLAGIPSVVFGFWGLVVLCPLVSKLSGWVPGGVAFPGPSLLSAILIVALMIIPTIMLIAESSINRVPKNFVQGAAALGMGRFTIIRSIVLPQAKSGVFTGIVLGIARAIGETMAVVMVAGNVVKLPASVFDPVRTLTANIALEMGYAAGVQRSSLFFSGLFLLGLVAVLFFVEIFLRRVVWRTN